MIIFNNFVKNTIFFFKYKKKLRLKIFFLRNIYVQYLYTISSALLARNNMFFFSISNVKEKKSYKLKHPHYHKT